MFSQPQHIFKLREERRCFAIHNQLLLKSQKHQKEKADTLEEELKKKDQLIREKDKAIEKLIGELENAKLTIDSYKKMLFAQHKQTEMTDEEKETQQAQETIVNEQPAKKRRGLKKGHIGYGRKRPETIDQTAICFVFMCPGCGNPVERSETYHSHTVTDIPHWREMKPVTTEYKIEYQWCGNCHKAVSAVPPGVIPGSRIGLTLFLMILIWRYQMRLPFQKISELLQLQYQLYLSAGAIVGITRKARKLFGKRYDDMLHEIRGGPVKHADETTWRMDGLLYWCWIFVTDKTVYYTIEESWGKGVVDRILKDAIGILVRDGYAAYKKLSLLHQVCFAHLYRKARDIAERKGASDEAKDFFEKIRHLYSELAEAIQRPFDKSERETLHAFYKKEIEALCTASYKHQDVRKVQTYLKNLGDNLLTALLHKNVPLTNNAAEQAALKIVVGRKISGGSKSTEGTKTHAVNMSIMQTILKQKLPLVATLESQIMESLPQSL